MPAKPRWWWGVPMSRQGHTLILKSVDICELEKWGLCNDAVNWPKSWWRVILKFFVYCGTLAFSSFGATKWSLSGLRQYGAFRLCFGVLLVFYGFLLSELD